MEVCQLPTLVVHVLSVRVTYNTKNTFSMFSRKKSECRHVSLTILHTLICRALCNGKIGMGMRRPESSTCAQRSCDVCSHVCHIGLVLICYWFCTVLLIFTNPSVGIDLV